MERSVVYSQPLTSAQRGMWMADMIAAKGSTYIIAEAIELPGPINEKLFIRALLNVAQEAEVLRSRFVETPEGPLQEILPDIRGEFPVIDVSEGPDPRGTAEDWMYEKIRTPVNFKTDQLWQNALFKLGPDNYLWYHAGHHVVFDGYSASIIVARVSELYSAMVEGRDPTPSTFLPASNLKEQEDAYRESPQYQKDEKHWLEYLDDYPDPVTLSLRPSRPPSGDYGGFINRTLHFNEERSRTLEAIAKARGATLPQALVALVAAYIMQVTGVKDLVLGMPIGGRGNKIMRQTPGMVANAAVLRFKRDDDSDFGSLLDQSKRAMRGALRHQQYRYEDLRKLFGKYENSQQVARLGVNIEPFDYGLSFGGVMARNVNLSNGAMEDLTVFAFHRQDGNGFVFKFDANPALYTRIELDRHINLFDRLASSLMAAPDAGLESHDLFGEDDVAEAKARYRSVKRSWPRNHISDMLEFSLSHHAERKLISDLEGDYDSADFAQDVRELADTLRQQGAAEGQLVGVALPRDRRMVVALFAIAATGAAWLPLDIYGPRERLQTILDDARPVAVLVDNTDEPDGLLDITTDKLIRLDFKPHFARDVSVVTPANVPDTPAPEQIVPEGTAYVSYTSGTTGKPKGVIIPHTALANFLYSMAELLPFNDSTRLLTVTTITFDIATLELVLPILVGGSLVIATKDQVLDPAGLTNRLLTQNVNTLQATPTLWQSLIAVNGGMALSNKVLLTGGEALPGHLAARMIELTDTAYNVYGPTETTIWSTWRRLNSDDREDPTVGWPLGNTDILILDEHQRLVPDGIIGELAIGGAGVATGYLNRPELTTERFIPTPEKLGVGRIYRTGDLAVRDTNGVLHVIGRTDDQVKIRGMRIEPGEVESALVALPEISQSAVVVEKDSTGGSAQLAAYLVAADKQQPLDIASVRQALRARVTSQMVPTKMAAVDSLPRMPSGKLDRRALKNIEVEAVEESGSGEYVAPRNESEQILADIWCEVLQLEKVDVTASFFDLGGDSLKVLQFVSELHRRGYDVPIGQVFTVPTIESLAPWFDKGSSQQADPLADLLPVRPTGSQPAIFCIHPVVGVSWAFAALAEQLPEDRPVYALQHARPVLDGSPYSSMEALAQHHLESMRSVQPSGPYNIVGWSMGGLLGYHIVKLLKEAGEEVESFTMLDAYPYRKGAENIPLERGDSIQAALDFLAIKLPEGTPTPDSLADLADLILEEALENVPENVRPSAEVLDRLATDLKQIVLYNMDLVRYFHPDRVEGNMLFIRADERLGSGTNDLLLDNEDEWAQFFDGDVEYKHIDCRHQDMLHPNNAAKIADLLVAYMDSATTSQKVAQ